MARGMRVGDINARYGMSTGQHVGAYFSLHDFPAGALTEADVEELGAQPHAAMVAGNLFTAHEAAIGLILGTALMLYLGSRVVVQVPK